MAKLAVYKYFSFMILVITIMTATFTLFGLFGGNANPVHETAMAMIVYVLPLFVIGNVITLIFWLIRRRWHWAAIPFVTLLCSIPYIGTLYQVNIFASAQEEQSGFKIASYNVAVFGRETTGFKAEDILTVMKQQQVDILCLQEISAAWANRKEVKQMLDSMHYTCAGGKEYFILSRLPALSDTIRISYPSKQGEYSIARWFAFGSDSLLVVNNHLESNHLSHEEKSAIAATPMVTTVVLRKLNLIIIKLLILLQM